MPEWIFPVIHFVYIHHRKIMGQAVIAQVVTKWPFRFFLSLPNGARDYKIGITGQYVTILPGVAEAFSPSNRMSTKASVRRR